MLPKLLLSAAFALVCGTQLFAQLETADTLRQLETPQVVIIARKDRVLGSVPGSASYVRPLALQRIAPISGNEVFRKLPGLHVVEEEGIGLRANIGVRGLDPDRSANVLVLEDGIPVQLNPYGEPEMYYTPSIDRMHSVEVVKGSGQILFGPRTIGGVVNYITAAPPAEAETKIGLKGGSGGYYSALLSHGNTFGNTGIQLNYLYKHADKMGITGFDVHDFNARFNIQLNERSVLGLKAQFYDETSNSTYIGLTQNMFDNGQYYAVIAPDDLLQVRRYAFSATHKYYLNSRLKITTNAYHYTISRDWRRQNFSSSASAAHQTGTVWGDTGISGGALYMLDESLARNRTFMVSGLETGLHWEYKFLGKTSDFDAGLRLLNEQALDQEVFANSPDALSGNLVNHEKRPGTAGSAYVQNKWQLGARLSVHAGLRMENYHFKREVLLYKSPSGAYRDTFISAPSTVSAFIPGLGFKYELNGTALVFGGLHKGFAPPGIKNSVSKSGVIYPLDGQESWNYELGFRLALPKGVDAELTGFLIDFQKQVISVSESSGGSGSGYANAGRTAHRGLEAGARVDAGEWLASNWSVYWEGNLTWTDARFNADRFIGAEAVNVNGNRLPYSPEWISNQAIGMATPGGFNLQLTGTYTGEQFTDELNTLQPTANGRTGRIPAFWLFDATAQYKVKKWNSGLFLSVKNLTDERYIASRRPQGIKTGLPRTVVAGLEVAF